MSELNFTLLTDLVQNWLDVHARTDLDVVSKRVRLSANIRMNCAIVSILFVQLKQVVVKTEVLTIIRGPRVEAARKM